jgi:hypothetical protein
MKSEQAVLPNPCLEEEDYMFIHSTTAQYCEIIMY